MNATRWTIAAAAGGLVCSLAGAAGAQDYYEGPYLQAPVLAPSRALEIGLSTEYTQGFGLLSASEGPLGDTALDALPSGGVNDTADAGIGFTLALGYRATPAFGLGWSGQYAEFDPGQDLEGRGKARGVTTSLDLTAHTMPYERVDPWISAGAGYRALWSVPDGPDNNVMTHGFQLAKVKLGADIRASDSVAIGPYIGADLDLFVWRNPEGPSGDADIDGKRVSTFVYAGLQGRFDLGGERRGAPIVPLVAHQ